MPRVPSGTVTFLFTDLEGSTRLWEERSQLMSAALARHDELVHGLIRAHGGTVFSGLGDGVAACFERATDAARAAVTAIPLEGQHGEHLGAAAIFWETQ